MTIINQDRRSRNFIIYDKSRKNPSEDYLQNYFGSIKHSQCRRELRKAGQEAAIEDMTMSFIKMYHAQDISLLEDPTERKRKEAELASDSACGATLGSQISQNMALVIPNDVDHLIKDGERIKH